MKAKETYLSRDFRETAAQRFPAQAKQLNAAFDMRLNALLAENAGASKEKQYHLKRQILPGIAAYDGNQKRYAQIAGHGFRILAAAIEKNLPYEIKCPALLICGTQDHAGSCIRYNKAWHRNTKIPLTWIEGAGHNSNTDKPEQVNRLIDEFAANIL